MENSVSAWVTKQELSSKKKKFEVVYKALRSAASLRSRQEGRWRGRSAREKCRASRFQRQKYSQTLGALLFYGKVHPSGDLIQNRTILKCAVPMRNREWEGHRASSKPETFAVVSVREWNRLSERIWGNVETNLSADCSEFFIPLQGNRIFVHGCKTLLL